MAPSSLCDLYSHKDVHRRKKRSDDDRLSSALKPAQGVARLRPSQTRRAETEPRNRQQLGSINITYI